MLGMLLFQALYWCIVSVLLWIRHIDTRVGLAQLTIWKISTRLARLGWTLTSPTSAVSATTVATSMATHAPTNTTSSKLYRHTTSTLSLGMLQWGLKKFGKETVWIVFSQTPINHWRRIPTAVRPSSNGTRSRLWHLTILSTYIKYIRIYNWWICSGSCLVWELVDKRWWIEIGFFIGFSIQPNISIDVRPTSWRRKNTTIHRQTTEMTIKVMWFAIISRRIGPNIIPYVLVGIRSTRVLTSTSEAFQPEVSGGSDFTELQ